MRTLLIGGSSYVGRPLHERLSKTGDVLVTYATTPIPGGRKFDALSMRLSDLVSPEDDIETAVILLADSDPGSCWRNQDQSQMLNVDATKRIIDDIITLGAKPVFLSSEAVYGGSQTTPFSEADASSPQFLYARQKIEIENYLHEKNVEHLIIRLARVFGFTHKDPTGLEDWISAMRTQQLIKCATDQFMSPISRADSVEGIAQLLGHRVQGVFNLAGAKQISRINLLKMFATFAKEHGISEPKIEPCVLKDFTMNEPRPLNSSMSNHRFHAVTGYEPASYEVLCRETAKCFRSEGL